MGWTARGFLSVVSAGVALGVGVASAAELVPSPADVLGIQVGKNRVLASYSESRHYLDVLAQRSLRVKVVELGTTVEGRPMIAAIVSSPANLARLAELRQGWASLADPRGLTEEARARLVASLPSCVLVTAGIHSNEVAGPQATLVLTHRLASASPSSPEGGWLDHTVLLLVPSVNPDGQEAVVAWYRAYLGTPYEGASPPFLYHRYCGHDNNRDFVYLTQPESRALNYFAYREWHPQVFLDLHQMGSTGPRLFVPPFAEPIAPNVNPLIWRMTSLIGSWMSWRLEQEGKAGVVSGWVFDGNWIGGTRNTGWWKNVFGLLTETAGAALATPIQVDESELKGGGKGLVDYRPQVLFPNPWRGGWWGLADAVSYQTSLMAALVEFAADHRRELLEGVTAMAATAVAKGRDEAPRAYAVAMNGEDPGRARNLVNLLLEAGVEGAIAPSGVKVDGVSMPAGTVVLPAGQPLRAYLVEVMERQSYPEIALSPEGDIVMPYDVTAWTMPLFLGVDVRRAEREVAGDLVPITAPLPAPGASAATPEGGLLAVPAGHLAGFAAANRVLVGGGAVSRLSREWRAGEVRLAAGSFVLAPGAGLDVSAVVRSAGAVARAVERLPEGAVPLRRVTVGVYHPSFGLEESGWCRWVLEQAGFAVEVVDNAAMRSGSFAGRVDVLVLPPLSGKVIVEGPEERLLQPPEEYRGGIGKEGTEALKRFFVGGGTVVAFASSAEWLAEALELPVSNPLRTLDRKELVVPGALLELAVEPATTLGWGMPQHVAAMVEAPVAFETRPVLGDTTRTVAARFPDGKLLLSGWIRGEEHLRRRVGAVELRHGEGRAVLFSFSPFFRGQTQVDFPLFYNAVLTEAMDPPRPFAPPATPVPAAALKAWVPGSAPASSP